MAKDYRRQNYPTVSKSKASRPFLVVFLSFLIGYLCAIFIHTDSVIQWVEQEWMKYHHPASVSLHTTQATSQNIKPKLEFYTLLTHESRTPTIQRKLNDDLAVQTGNLKKEDSHVAAEKNQALTAAYEKSNYLVQVASYRTKQDADRMKVALILKGFQVNVVMVRQGSLQWYRVIIGPYHTRDQAVQAQNAIAKSERLVGMIRRMDA